MAITNAQQYQQLVNKSADGKRPGYRGPGGYQGGASSRSGPPGGGATAGGSGRDFSGGRDSGGRDTGPSQGPSGGGGRDLDYQQRGMSAEDYAKVSQQYKDEGTQQVYNKPPEPEPEPKPNILDQIINFVNPSNRRRQLYNLATNFLPGSKQSITTARKAYADYLEELGLTPSKELLDTDNLYDFFDKQAFEKGKTINTGVGIDELNEKIFDKLTRDDKNLNKYSMEEYMNINPDLFSKGTPTEIKSYGDFIAEKFGMPGVKYSGDVGGLDMYVAERDPITGKPTKYGYKETRNGRNGEPVLPLTPYQEDVVEDEVDPNSLEGILANRGLAYRFMADGGRAGFAGGGMPYEGGIMDLESARQMYGLGKLVKKATGAIKKIVKSPVGKAALLGGLGFLGMKSPAVSGFFKNKFMPFMFKGGEFGLKNLTKGGALASIGGLSALTGLFAGQDEEDEVQPYYRGPGLDIDAIRRNPYGTKGPAFGFYAKGGDVKEPVAKDTMPLLDMNGMEKDYRADGGFVPIGRMERADDVPARLSKNEFVFTADAVRNAGDGDIDKGAEVMYNVMKNLEAGGNISEESQGLNGAREMFQTSKRLEEVL